MKIKLVISVLFYLAACVANAENNTYIVTGTRTSIEANKLPIASTVINRIDIEKSQVKTLPELLEGVVGLDVIVSGGYGKEYCYRCIR